MSKRIRIEINKNGDIQMKTLGMQGEECLDYVEVAERLLDAVAIDSSFTEEYYQTVEVQQVLREQNKIKGE